MTTRQWLRLGMALGAAAVALWIAWLAGAALAPFLVGAVLAYLLTPLVQWLAGLTSVGGRPHKPWARPVAIVVIYVVAAGLLSGLGLVAVPIVVRNIQELVARREELMEGFQRELDGLLFFYRDRVPVEAQQQIDAWVRTFLEQAGSFAASVAQSTFDFALQSFSVMLGFLVIPIWLFLFVKDQPRFAAWFYGLFPVWLRPDVREVVRRASSVLGSYLRAQVVLATIVGVASYVGLTLLGVPFAIPLAVVAFFSEFIPIIGPIIAGAVALAVVLAVEPGWLLLWVLLLYVGIQQVENYLLVPRIHGNAMHVHPAIIILLVVILGQIMGILGILIAVPAYATLRNTFVYVYRRLGESETLPGAVEEVIEREPVAADRARRAPEEREAREEEAA